ncbi:MAG: chlorophyll synthase ChlG [Myxococcota bacterium]
MGDRGSARATDAPLSRRFPQPSALVELLKPITWFAPMWALGCGVVSAAVPLWENAGVILATVLLAGPLVCGTSQAVNDWFDRHVDAINEPNRPIPSGRVPGRWGLYVALVWTGVALVVAGFLGVWVFGAAVFGLALAWMYSAPPFRLKRNGWWGNAAVGLCYEGLPWFTGAAALSTVEPDGRIVALALLYSLGAHGIMVLNDFKALEGDQKTGVRSIPVQLGVPGAVRLACSVMALPQLVVTALLFAWGQPVHGGIVAALLGLQLILMTQLAQNPRDRAAWYNATGTTLYVLGMLVSAFAIRGVLMKGL